MGVRKVWLLAILVGLSAQVHAQEPTPAEPAPAPAAVPTPATPAPPSKSAMPPMREDVKTKEPQKSTAIEGELDADKIMAAQKAGYELRNENGEQLLCRKEPRTGSRLRPAVSCMTAKQWEQLQSDTQTTLRTIERRRVGPNNN